MMPRSPRTSRSKSHGWLCNHSLATGDGSETEMRPKAQKGAGTGAGLMQMEHDLKSYQEGTHDAVWPTQNPGATLKLW